MSNSSEIQRLQNEIYDLNARKEKCNNAINQVTAMCTEIETARTKLNEARDYLSTEYMGKRTGKITDKMDVIDNNAITIKELYANDMINDLKNLKYSIESQIRRKREKIADLKAESAGE